MFKHATCILFIIISVVIGQNIIDTPKYGGNGGNNGVTATPYINLGKIRGMKSWGYDVTTWTGALSQFSWYYDYPDTSIENSITFGSYSIETDCGQFILPTNDYIHGYRVLIQKNINDTVRGITFYTYLGSTYECQWGSLDLDNMIDSGPIYHYGYYLSGFYMIDYSVLNQIGFQFTSVSPSLVAIIIMDKYCDCGLFI